MTPMFNNNIEQKCLRYIDDQIVGVCRWKWSRKGVKKAWMGMGWMKDKQEHGIQYICQQGCSKFQHDSTTLIVLYIFETTLNWKHLLSLRYI
jgi:hypothetical protein